jgi:hypothetical protein
VVESRESNAERAVETATRRPAKRAFRPTSAMSGPGATITTAETARNGIRFTAPACRYPHDEIRRIA